MQSGVLNIERRQHPHQVFAFEFLDLSQLAGKRRDFGFGVVHFGFLLHHHAVDRGLTVFCAFGVKIDNVFFVPDPGHFSGRVFHPLLLLANLFVHRRDRAI